MLLIHLPICYAFWLHNNNKYKSLCKMNYNKSPRVQLITIN